MAFALFITGCADAGKDQSVVSNTTVTLDGNASKVDFNGQIKKYRWKQTDGKKVKLSDKKTINPTFTSPTVTEETILTFRLTTVEKGGFYSPWRTRDEVNIIVNPTSDHNTPPSAVAEANTSSVKYGDSVTFNASNSTDSDGQIVSYEWKDENNLTLSAEVQFAHTFDTIGTHTVALTVTDDDGLSTTDTVNVTVEVLQKPLAVINTDTDTIFVGESISFDANASSDADGEIVSYQWLDETNTTLSMQKSFTYTFTSSGEYNITLVVTDDDGEEGRASVDIVVEAQLVSVSLEATTPTLDVNTTTSLTATAHYNDNTSQDATSSVEWIVTDTNIVSVDVNGTLIALSSGTTTVKVKIGDIVSNTVSIEVTTPTLLQSISVSPNPIELRVGQSIQVSVLGLYSDGTTQAVEDADYVVNHTNIASVDGTGSLDALAEGVTTLRANVGGVLSPLVSISVGVELNTTNFNFTNFGSTYTNQIPVNATLNQYDEKRFCMIAGQIKAEDGSPLSGVTVSIHKYDEYGSTFTDSNGTYVIPAEGGLQLTMRYTKTGYTTIDRKVFAPVQDWVRSPDVTMLAVDTKVTQINLSNTTPQMHISTPVTDDRGVRSTTLVFDGVTRATVTARDGSTRELTNLNVRATEFATPESMPSDLPRQIAFTYCSDIKVDGVADDENVTFDAPVIMYVENFIGFPEGGIVPVGYYDRNKGKWIGSKNGIVVRLLDTDGDGTIDALDSNGSGTANDLDGDGEFSDEVSGISDNSNYKPGETFWRVEIRHFTPWDHNWPWPDGTSPNDDDVDADDDDIYDDCSVDINSYVTTKSRVFHEDISIAGTNQTLHYSSKRTEGYKHSIEVTVDTTDVYTTVWSAIIRFSIAGRVIQKEFNTGGIIKVKLDWDGLDATGKPYLGDAKGTVTVGYRNVSQFIPPKQEGEISWGKVTSKLWSDIFESGCQNCTTGWRILWGDPRPVDVLNERLNQFGQGWSISNHDRAFGSMLLRGDGSSEKKEIHQAGTISIAAGGNGEGFSGDGGLATDAQLRDPWCIATDIQGNLYIGDNRNYRIRKVDTQGIISTIAGSGDTGWNLGGFSGDGGLATEALISRPRDIEVDTIGNIYFIDTDNHRIRKVDTQGIINTVIENTYAKSLGIDKDNNLYYIDATKIVKILQNGDEEEVLSLASIGLYDYYCYNSCQVGLTIDNQNNIYFSHGYSRKIYKIDRVNRITVLGETESEIRDISVDAIGNIYAISASSKKAYKIDIFGNITVIGGENEKFGYPLDIAINSFYDIYIVNMTNDRIEKVALPSFFRTYNLTHGQTMLTNPNNTADIFDAIGKHLKTIDLNTGNSLKEFGYDANNHLISITDNFAQTTTITRDTNGNPTTITAPNGQTTTLTVDEQGNLTQVSYEDNSKYKFTYFNGSLMDIMTDPNGNTIQHVWNDAGRIVEEVDGLNGSYKFLRNVTGGETFYSTVLPEGETSTSKDVKLANGDTQSTMTLATGETVTATFASDEKYTSSLRDGVETKNTYTTDALTQQLALAKKEVTQPSGLKSTSTYSTTYDGNKTHTNTKTQSVITNAKTSTNITNYNNGTETLTSPENRVATRTYDVDTLLTSSISTGSLTPSTYTYDNKGRVTKESTGTREITYTYDAKGNLAALTNERGKTTSYSYDVMDRLTEVTYPNNTREHFTYDANGNLLTRTVPTPADHTFSYNGADLRVSNTSPLNKFTTYTYDKSKNITAITKPSGKTITNNYSNGRLESTTTPEGTSTYAYLFASKVGSITTSTGSATDEKFTFTYDGTLVTSTTQSGVLNHTTNFTYNNDFQVSSSTYAGQTESYSYDDDGLLLSSGAYTLTRDTQNAYTTQVTDGTLTQNRSYNDFGEITEVADNTFTYELSQRDQSGAITQKKETLNGVTETFDYIFDDMGRLVEVQKNNAITETYTYDNNGNRASATVNGTNITASYTLDDNLVVYGDNTYKYDADGYLEEKVTPDGTSTYSYGTMGELLSVSTPTQSITYKHNANNQRVAKLINGTVAEKYLWANLTTLLAIYDKDDNLKQRFEYADQRTPVAMTKGADKFYLHYDQVGSLRAVTDSSHNIVKEIVYDTYGNVLTDSNEAFTVPFGFAGGLYDQDTKLTRFGYRDYDAYTGKWTAKDPIGFDGGDSNLYGYVLGDSVNFMDPEGLESNTTNPIFPNLPPPKPFKIPKKTWWKEHLNPCKLFPNSPRCVPLKIGCGGGKRG